ncbi:MAG TPA: formate dehydrogenase accessory sulfurtransferase FdhD [Verrucomicrobiae bacterium]|nr:formate dehydrogenase accessory sulfurtransferase FdhD [Verrucomicrobiae bacterium]
MVDEPERPGRSTPVGVVRCEGDALREGRDDVATEEPLEIRLRAGGRSASLAVTMRTPGNDLELAAGFLFSEGIAGPERIAGIAYCLDPELTAEQRYNVVTVDLHAPELPDLAALERHFLTSSACGVCGRASLDALRERGVAPLADGLRVEIATLYALPGRMRAQQRVFAETGGLHAAALFDARGVLLALREDVGRHNALDKLIGWGVLEGRGFAGTLLAVSGRTSYEIVQKAASAGIPVVCGISAPSSLAVRLADEFGITLAGFLRGERCNLYAHPQRVLAQPPGGGGVSGRT